MRQNNDQEIREAIKALADTAKDNELLGYGSLPPVSVRIEAAISIGEYVPHPEAVKALQDILKQSWAPEEVRAAAARALGGRR